VAARQHFTAADLGASQKAANDTQRRGSRPRFARYQGNSSRIAVTTS